MKILPVYRVLTYILLPFGAYFGLQALLSVLVALGNPFLMLSTFIIACMVIYIFCSFFFLQKGISKAQPCKKSLKDWIKVNAIVSILFASLCIISMTVLLLLLNNPDALKQALAQAAAQQKTAFPIDLTDPKNIQAIKNTIYIMLPFSIILFVHLILTFRMLKLYKHVFEVQ